MTVVLDHVATQDAFAAMVGITQPRVAALLAEGILPRGGTLAAWLLAYAERLREQAAGRGQELTIERALLAREQRIGQRIKNAVAQRDYAPVGLLADVLAAASASMVDRFDALTAELAVKCPELDEQARAVVHGVINDARNEWVRGTASLSAEILTELTDEEGDDLTDAVPDDHIEPSGG
jgi:hypothetical protein